VTLSSHTARAPTGICRLHVTSTVPPGSPVDRVYHFGAQPLRSTPITGVSTLQRVGPPLTSASLFQPRVFALAPFRLPSLARFACSTTEPELDSRRLYPEALRNQ